MALHETYEQFLSAPNPALLASNASLHYIPTLTSFNGPEEIIRHLKVQAHSLHKPEEKFLDIVEGQNALAIEIHTTIEFLTGGSSYLPGLDDNFLTDRIVTFPIVRLIAPKRER